MELIVLLNKNYSNDHERFIELTQKHTQTNAEANYNLSICKYAIEVFFVKDFNIILRKYWKNKKKK